MSSSSIPKKPHHFVIKVKNGLITKNNSGQTRKYTQLKSKAHSSAAEEYFKLKILKNEALSQQPPENRVGIYTWIMIGEDFDSANVYAAKVRGKQEIGTMHRDIYSFSESKTDHNESDIVAAGELEIKADGNVEFNFLSGTYFKKFIPVKIGKEEYMEKLAENVGPKIASLGFDNVEYIQSRAIINAANIIATPNYISNLNLYFNKEGGKRRTKRNKTKKRYVKNKN